MIGDRRYGIRELANWILDYADRRGLAITNMALNKLIYFAYEHALLSAGRKLTNAKIEAWEHGPVFREIYREFSRFGSQPITSRAKKFDPATNSVDIAVPSLTPSDAALVEEAVAPLVRLPASTLRDLSHSDGGPWARTWFHEDTTNPGMQITDDLIRVCNTRKDVAQ